MGQIFEIFDLFELFEYLIDKYSIFDLQLFLFESETLLTCDIAFTTVHGSKLMRYSRREAGKGNLLASIAGF